MRSWLEGLFHILFPRVCPACGDYLPKGCPVVCVPCEARLPFTHYHLDAENPFLDRFWGRLPVERGAAMLYFSKGGSTQHLLHQIKYQGQKQLAFALGDWYGQELKQAAGFSTVDLIVPVPLHPRKYRKRGFNQSLWLGNGLSRAMEKPCTEDILKRTQYTQTQTRKSRLERLANVSNAFEVRDPERIAGKHVLLVDDVLTTGATLEACGLKILEVEGTRLSMATLAIADK